MDGVGTSQGAVNRQQQGTGLATVLQGSDALRYAISHNDQEKARRQALADAAKAKRDAALRKIQALAPEYWYKHTGEISSALDNHVEKGVELLGQQVDPFSSSDQRAVDFQKEHARIAAMAESSKQLKEQYTKLRQEIDGSNPDDYDPRSISNIDAFYSRPLGEIVDERATPPTLIKKRAFMDAFNFVGKNMQEWSKTWGEGSVPGEVEIMDFVTALGKDPANLENVSRSYSAKFTQMDDAEKKRILSTAQNGQIEFWQQMAYEDALRWRKTQEKFNPLDALKESAKTVEGGLDYSSWENPNAFGTAVNSKDFEKSLGTVANAMINSDPRWMSYYEETGQVPRYDDETDGQYSVRVKKKLIEDIRPLVGINRKSGRTAKGEGEHIEAAGRNAFIQDMRSGDSVAAQSAANWLTGTKFSGNMSIDGAFITESPQGFVLELDIATPMGVQLVKEQLQGEFGAGAEVSDVVEKQGKKTVKVYLGQDQIANQSLARLYDNTTKATGKNYDPKITERTPKTAREAMKTVYAPLKEKPAATADFLFQ